MKTLKIISYVSLAILLFEIGLTVSVPLRFPGSSIAWSIVLTSDLLLASLCGLLFLLPRVRPENLQKILIGLALSCAVFTFIDWTPWIISEVFLIALLAVSVISARYARV
jgi:hypothetical protein